MMSSWTVFSENKWLSGYRGRIIDDQYKRVTLKMLTVARGCGPTDLHFWQYMFPKGLTHIATVS
jgi:hypothetical protein